MTIQAQILDLMQELKDRLGMAVMLITHAMGVVAEVAQRVVVMYAGKVVEEAPVGELFAHPRHPYTQGLIRSIPRIDRAATHKVRLEAIPRHRAQADQPGAGLPVRRALSVRARRMPGRNAAAARSGARPQGGLHRRHRREVRAAGEPRSRHDRRPPPAAAPAQPLLRSRTWSSASPSVAVCCNVWWTRCTRWTA